MKRPQLVPQGTIQRMRQSAEQAWHERDLLQCVELLERASRLAPADTGVLLQLGRMYGLTYDYPGAERCFEKALRLVPEKTKALGAIGLQSRDFYNTELALRYLQRAAEQPNASADILISLAEVYERMRRMDDAAAMVDRAMRMDGGSPPTLLAQARLTQRSGKPEEAEKILRSFLDKADPQVRAKAYYELGAILDRQGRYDEAMQSFLDAKNLLRQDAAPHLMQLKRVRTHVAQLREQLTPEVFRRWLDYGRELQPAYRLTLLCGHPRSGTTLLEQVLDSHPDMRSAEETTHFTDYAFGPIQRHFPIKTPMLQILESAPKELLLSGRTNYFRASEACLGTALNGRMLIDKNPSLTLMLPAVTRVFPETKILVALRDPRDVCLSCFMQPFVPIQQVSSSYLNLDATVEEYGSLMDMWRTVSSMVANPFLEVRYEDMVEDLGSIARKVLAFLAVDWDERVLGFDEHARKKLVRSPTYADVTQKVFKRARGRWLNYQKHLEPHLPKLERFVKAFGYE